MVTQFLSHILSTIFFVTMHWRQANMDGEYYGKMTCRNVDELQLLNSWKNYTNNHNFEFFKEDESKWKGPFYFIQGADPQLGLIERYIEKKENPGWEKEIALSEKAVQKINAMRPKPKFFVICGDLCDAVPVQNPKLRYQQEVDFKRIYEKLDPEIPLVCVSGNHDLADIPTEETVSTYHSSFGDDYFSFWYGGIYFLVINTQFLTDSSKTPKQAMEHEQWLNSQLEKIKQSKARAVVFQHIPWFINSPEEESDGYFSIRTDVRQQWLKKLKDAGVEHIFAGHLHRNAGGVFEGMPVTVTTAIGGQLGSDKSGVRIVKVLDKEIQQQFYALDDLPSTIDV